MVPIVAEIIEEIHKIVEDLTGDASVSIGDVEEHVSAATASWGQKLSEGILCENANAPEMDLQVCRLSSVSGVES